MYLLKVEELEFQKKFAREVYDKFLDFLESGELRCAYQDDAHTKKYSEWQVETRVKEGILLGFRIGELENSQAGDLTFCDKDTLRTQKFAAERKVRIVPGGSSVRRGAYVAPGVIMMPPAYINIGAFVDSGTLIDSHALVGSCAQIGKNVHVSAAAQIGGVLEPIGARPVIVEDNAFVGGNTGIYEGCMVKSGAIIAAGVVLTSGTKVYDLVREQVLQGTTENPLTIPENAIVVPGTRPARGKFATENNLQIASPLIVKYKGEESHSKAELENYLR